MGQAYHREWVTKIIYLAAEEVSMESLRKDQQWRLQERELNRGRQNGKRP